jgi:hypothetical protein
MELKGFKLSNDLSAIGYALIKLDMENQVVLTNEAVSDLDYIVESIEGILHDNQVDFTTTIFPDRAVITILE